MQFANISSTDAGARILNSIATDSDTTSELIAATVDMSTGKVTCCKHIAA